MHCMISSRRNGYENWIEVCGGRIETKRPQLGHLFRHLHGFLTCSVWTSLESITFFTMTISQSLRTTPTFTRTLVPCYYCAPRCYSLHVPGQMDDLLCRHPNQYLHGIQAKCLFFFQSRYIHQNLCTEGPVTTLDAWIHQSIQGEI